jgi:hypothetical protein
MPPLKPWQIMPVPPPTFPSTTGPSEADASASKTCSALTWKPSMSFRRPSHVSPTTGSAQSASPRAPQSASRTTPTLWVFVSATGVVRKPDSRIQASPVSSPLPLRRCEPAKWIPSGGRTTVTPVRTSSPSTRVVWPTRRPATSVMAFRGPGLPSPMRRPSSRALTTGSRRAPRRACAPSARASVPRG